MSGEPYWFVGLKQLTSGHNDVLSKKKQTYLRPWCQLFITHWTVGKCN